MLRLLYPLHFSPPVGKFAGCGEMGHCDCGVGPVYYGIGDFTSDFGSKAVEEIK